MPIDAVARTPLRPAKRPRAERKASLHAFEQQIIGAAIETARECTREVRLLIDQRRDRRAGRVVNSGARWTETMQNNDAIGSKPSERSDWSNAFEAVSRLAAVRELTLHDIAQDQAAVSIPEPAGVEEAASNVAADSAAQTVSRDDRDQLALAVAEIEKASAVLREA